LNSFLCAFIDHSLPTHQYYIRNRYFIEKIFNYEFQIGIGPNLIGYIDNLFFVGKSIKIIDFISFFYFSKQKIMKKLLHKYYFMVKKIIYLFGI
jgi:hypothetical protein